jgi:hypothetical protein
VQWEPTLFKKLFSFTEFLSFMCTLHLIVGVLSVLGGGVGECKRTCSFLFPSICMEGVWLELLLEVLHIKNEFEAGICSVE